MSFTALKVFLVGVLLGCTGFTDATRCGGFIDLDKDPDGTLTTPNFGTSASYDDEELCIWLLEAPVGKRVKLTVSFVKLEVYSGTCRDYIEIRDGSSQSTQRYYHCWDIVGGALTSPSRWLWIKFKSDHSVSGSGFSIKYEMVNGRYSDSRSVPYQECSGASFWQCTNKECVARTSLCDGKNQCGDFSDEINLCTTTPPATTQDSTSLATTVPNPRFGTHVPVWVIIVIVAAAFVVILVIIGILQFCHIKQKQNLMTEIRNVRPASDGGQVHNTGYGQVYYRSDRGGDAGVQTQTQSTINGRSVLPPISVPPNRPVYGHGLPSLTSHGASGMDNPPPYEEKPRLPEGDVAYENPVFTTSESNRPPGQKTPRRDPPSAPAQDNRPPSASRPRSATSRPQSANLNNIVSDHPLPNVGE